MLHVICQADGIERHLRVDVPAHQRLGLEADRAVTQGGALCTATDNANVFHFS
jgi:hypothetical protein